MMCSIFLRGFEYVTKLRIRFPLRQVTCHFLCTRFASSRPSLSFLPCFQPFQCRNVGCLWNQCQGICLLRQGEEMGEGNKASL